MMRQLALISGLMLATNVYTASAKPLTEKELDALTDAVLQVGDMAEMKAHAAITAAEEDENGLITSLTLAGKSLEDAKTQLSGELTIKFGKAVQVGVKLNYMGDVPQDHLSNLFGFGKRIHNAVDKAGYYQLKSHVEATDFTTGSIRVAFTPKPGAGAETINSASAQIHADNDSGEVSADLQISFNADARLVKLSRQAISDIIASVRAGDGITEEALINAVRTFTEVTDEVMNSLNTIMGS